VRTSVGLALSLAAFAGMAWAETAAIPDGGPGIAARYVRDGGLASDPRVVFFDNLEGRSSKLARSGCSVDTTPGRAFDGAGCLLVPHEQGSHKPMAFDLTIPAGDCYFFRWYAYFPEGYDFGKGEKAPGFHASAAGVGGGHAGERPNGRDRFTAKICYGKGGEAHFYYYHMDQKGGYGDIGHQNVGQRVRFETGQWYCMELMVRANDVNLPAPNGAMRMWIDGQLRAKVDGIRFRSVNTLTLKAHHSAYFGGHWTSPKTQSRFEDNFVIARGYIGPMVKVPPKPRTVVARKMKPAMAPEEAKRAQQEKEAGRLYQMARQAERMGQRDVAKRLYGQIVERFAETSIAEKARAKID